MAGRIEKGDDIAAWFNARAKQVTPKIVRAFKDRFPNARLFSSETLEQARLDATELVHNPPRLLCVGGGDGTIVTILNALREAGATAFPPLAFFKLGTGNGWSREVSAQTFKDTLRWLPRCPLPTPVRHYELVEVEGRLCHFAGAGWDATVLHDYRKNLERRARQAVASRIAARANRGTLGYVYSILRYTVPEEAARGRDEGRVRLTIRNLGAPALEVDKEGKPKPVARTDGLIWRGPMGFAGVATEPLWGGNVRAFPYATLVPGTVNLRVYDRSIFQAVRHGVDFWQGRHLPGMHDFLATGARFEFSRPMAFHVGGDLVGRRETLELRVAPTGVDVVDWPRAHLAAGPLD